MSESVAATAENARHARRRKILKEGIIAFNGGHSTLPTTVRDWSDTGARLAYSARQPLPPRFRLLVPLDAVQVNCEVVWHRQGLVGVKFVGPVEQTTRQRAQVVKTSDELRGTKGKTAGSLWEAW
jgi:hypothetical protein